MRYINGLLFEYKEAKDYFKENNLIKQEQDANNKCIEIETIKTKLKTGNLINNLPIPINPEYIYGYSTSERNNKFKEILNNFINQKNIIQNEINRNSSQNIEENKNKMQKLDLIIKEIERKYNNIWVPAPEYEKELKQYKNEKIFYDNCDFNIKIQLKKLDNKKEKIILLFILKINKSKNITKEIKMNYQEHFYEEWIWTLKYNEWRNIDNNDDNYIFGVNIYQNELNKNILNKYMQFDIAKIINGKIYSFNRFIQLTNNDVIQFNINIIPIFPKGNKCPVNEIKKNIILKNIFPAFIGKTPFTNNY